MAHCRHLKTVRQHLSGLTFHEPTSEQNSEWSNGLQEEYWRSYLDYIEQQNIKLKGPQKLQQGSSCRSRPLEISVSATHNKEHGINGTDDGSIEENQNGCNDTNERTNTTENNSKDGPFNASEIYWRIFYGGIESTIRPQVTLPHFSIVTSCKLIEY